MPTTPNTYRVSVNSPLGMAAPAEYGDDGYMYTEPQQLGQLTAKRELVRAAINNNRLGLINLAPDHNHIKADSTII